MAQDGVRFGILGPVEMCVTGDVVPLGTPKQRAALATLVIHRNRIVGIDELISAVWGTDAPKGARHTLHTYVSNVRRLAARPGIDVHAVLAAVPPGYRLSVPDNDCDLGRFIVNRTNGVNAAAAGRFEEASGLFTAALSEWRGPVLGDLRDFTFFDAFVTALDEDKLMTQLAHAKSEIACGRPLSVIRVLESLAAEHPYREPLWAQLIAAYYLGDHQSEALAAYHRLRTALAEDLGIDPGSAVRSLYARILRQEPLDVLGAAQSHADETMKTFRDHVAPHADHADGPVLLGADGSCHPVLAMTTRIGRSPANDIVLGDPKVSRYHAAVIDTGSSFVIADLQSANGVYLQGRRIHAGATLANGDVVRIGDHRFAFEVAARGHGDDVTE